MSKTLGVFMGEPDTGRAPLDPGERLAKDGRAGQAHQGWFLGGTP